LKVTVIEQLPVDATELPHVVVAEKSAASLTSRFENVIALAPGLPTVTVVLTAAVPTV
jgi:hypothetical protein